MQSVILSAATSALTVITLLRRRHGGPIFHKSFILEWLSANPERKYFVSFILLMFLFTAIRSLRRFTDEV